MLYTPILHGSISYSGASRHFSGNVSARSIMIPIYLFCSALSLCVCCRHYTVSSHSFLRLPRIFLLHGVEGVRVGRKAGIRGAGRSVAGMVYSCVFFLGGFGFRLAGPGLGWGLEEGKNGGGQLWKADRWLLAMLRACSENTTCSCRDGCLLLDT